MGGLTYDTATGASSGTGNLSLGNLSGNGFAITASNVNGGAPSVDWSIGSGAGDVTELFDVDAPSSTNSSAYVDNASGLPLIVDGAADSRYAMVGVSVDLIPEPTTTTLLAGAVMGLLCLRRRRN